MARLPRRDRNGGVRCQVPQGRSFSRRASGRSSSASSAFAVTAASRAARRGGPRHIQDRCATRPRRSSIRPLLETTPLSRSHSHDPRRARHRPRAQPSSFRCVNCRLDVPSDAPGTEHRNHCPTCLWSRQVDDRPGDRAMLDDCGSGMEPIAISVRGRGEWVIIHRCAGCGELDANRSAGDDSPLLLLRLAVKPLALSPFPLDRLALV